MHLVQTMAYAGAKPWHGLGKHLTPNQPLEVWASQAGMDWRIESSDVQYSSGQPFPDTRHEYSEQKVLYRSDTKAPLSVVSSRYKVVQPAEILEFYRDLTEIGGYELETAGVLKGGKKFWALARTNQRVILKGGDTINGYLLLATACDGTLATMAQFTSVRVVCNNTLAIALGRGIGTVKVPHRTAFDANTVKQQLGVAIAPWSTFEGYVRALGDCRVSEKETDDFLDRVLTYTAFNVPGRPVVAVSEQAIARVRALFDGQGLGANLASARGTAWGLLNSVTEFVDHHRRAQSEDHRRDAAWFGSGAQIKRKAWEEALKFVC